MGSTFDMNTILSLEQSRSQIQTLLVSVGLANYMELIDRAGIDFHAFCNLSRDDMRRVGIINHEHQSYLIEAVRPMAATYRGLENYKVDWYKIAKNMTTSSQLLAGSLIVLNETLKTRPIIHHSLVDSDTSSIQALLVLIDLMESRIDLIDQDLKEILRKADVSAQKRSKNWRNKLVSSGLLVLAGAAIWYIKKPFQVPGIRYLAG